MSTQLRTAPPETAARSEVQTRPISALTTLTGLVSDIGSDAQTLVTQHGSLLKAELKETRNQAVFAVVLVAAGAVGTAIGALFLLIGLVHLTVYLFPTLPEFAAWLIWGGVIALTAVVAALVGARTIAKLELVPRRTLHSLKESWSCLVNRLK